MPTANRHGEKDSRASCCVTRVGALIDLITATQDVPAVAIRESAGVSYGLMRSLVMQEQGRQYRTERLVRLAQYFRVGLEYLLCRTDDPYFDNDIAMMPFSPKLPSVVDLKEHWERWGYPPITGKVHVTRKVYTRLRRTQTAPPNSHFQSRIRAIRVLLSLRREDLVTLMNQPGLTLNSLVKIEGQPAKPPSSPLLSTGIAFAEAFNVSMDYLYCLSDDPSLRVPSQTKTSDIPSERLLMEHWDRTGWPITRSQNT